MDIEAMRQTFGELLTSLQRLREAEAEIENLKGTVRVINERVQSLVAENDNLKHELYSVIAERDIARRDVEEKIAEGNHLRDTIAQRDGNISYLDGVVNGLKDDLVNMTGERDANAASIRDLEDRARVLEDQITHLTNALEHTRAELETRTKQYSDMERESLHWQARFHAVDGVLNAMREALSNVPAVVTPVAA